MQTQDEADARYTELAYAGITKMYIYVESTSIDMLLRALKSVEKSGVKIIITLEHTNESTISIVEMTKDYPAVIGYNLKDEPSATLYKKLGALRDAISKIISKDKIIMVNLLPNYATDKQLGTYSDMDCTSYQNYVKECMDVIRPTLLSTDYYPFAEDKQNDNSLFAGMLRNLIDLRNAGTKYNVDVWGFLQNSGWTDMREPNICELRFSAHLNLALGVKSLSYFLC